MSRWIGHEFDSQLVHILVSLPLSSIILSPVYKLETWRYINEEMSYTVHDLKTTKRKDNVEGGDTGYGRLCRLLLQYIINYIFRCVPWLCRWTILKNLVLMKKIKLLTKAYMKGFISEAHHWIGMEGHYESFAIKWECKKRVWAIER